jgi:hypothetical protein
MGGLVAEGFVQAFEVRKALFRGTESRYQGVGSVFGDKVFMVWMDEHGNVWGEIRELSDLRIHSTMDWQVEK